MRPIKRLGGNAINARVVIHGGVAYVSGIVAGDKSADITGQTRQVLAMIDKHLADAGTSKARLLSAVVYLPDMAMKDAMNAVWSAWIDTTNPPARACVGATPQPPKMVAFATTKP